MRSRKSSPKEANSMASRAGTTEKAKLKAKPKSNASHGKELSMELIMDRLSNIEKEIHRIPDICVQVTMWLSLSYPSLPSMYMTCFKYIFLAESYRNP